jgi:primosomal protein N' (replication factor Y) (superfamily II helicase)
MAPPGDAALPARRRAGQHLGPGLGRPAGIDVLGPSDGRWLLRAPNHAALCAALAATARPAGRLRVEVDPLRV